MVLYLGAEAQEGTPLASVALSSAFPIAGHVILSLHFPAGWQCSRVR